MLTTQYLDNSLDSKYYYLNSDINDYGVTYENGKIIEHAGARALGRGAAEAAKRAAKMAVEAGIKGSQKVGRGAKKMTGFGKFGGKFGGKFVEKFGKLSVKQKRALKGVAAVAIVVGGSAIIDSSNSTNWKV